MLPENVNGTDIILETLELDSTLITCIHHSCICLNINLGLISATVTHFIDVYLIYEN